MTSSNSWTTFRLALVPLALLSIAGCAAEGPDGGASGDSVQSLRAVDDPSDCPHVPPPPPPPDCCERNRSACIYECGRCYGEPPGTFGWSERRDRCARDNCEVGYNRCSGARENCRLERPNFCTPVS